MQGAQTTTTNTNQRRRGVAPLCKAAATSVVCGSGQRGKQPCALPQQHALVIASTRAARRCTLARLGSAHEVAVASGQRAVVLWLAWVAHEVVRASHGVRAKIPATNTPRIVQWVRSSQRPAESADVRAKVARALRDASAKVMVVIVTSRCHRGR